MVLILEWLALVLACLTLMWGPLAQGSTFGWGLDGLILLGGLTCAVFLMAAAVRGRVHVSNPWWLAAALAFLGWIWASTGWAPYRWEALLWAGAWTAIIGTAICLHLLATTRGKQAVVLGVMALTGATALALAYLQTLGVVVPFFTYPPNIGPGMVTGPYFNPSHFSGFLIPIAALLVSLILFTRPHIHTLILAAFLVMLHVLNLKTDSSSIPGVLLATALPLLVWIWTKSKWVGTVLTVLACGSVLAGAFLFLQPEGQKQFSAYQKQIGLNNTWSRFLEGRQGTWRYGREMWQQAPLTGVGIGQLSSEAPRYRAREREAGTGIDRKAVNYAHSDALQLLAELGLPGLVLAFLTLGLPLMHRRSTPAQLVWWTALPVLLFVGLYDSHATAIPGTAMLIFALASLAAVCRPVLASKATDREAARTSTAQAA
ncbi:hypothetical protein GCM10010841_01040 [Deinococcus aerophilus]|uniref:O-antigen ligase-related domain-containing protein n=1 Tax=Deinococcus aerophilus TaxID=522488 RepID=A0ABQ2GHA1_9DEIO|nr:hypothetical protein GCM10010841_01040 [Deinococcus aerophilus]